MYKGSSLANKLGYMPESNLFWTAAILKYNLTVCFLCLGD
jgi:hypothetical protein